MPKSTLTRHLHLVPEPVTSPGSRQFVPANLPCPPWCADCWQGSNHGDDPDPGVSFHHSLPTIVETTTPEGYGPHRIGIELERLDNVNVEGRTSIWLNIPDESAQYMSLDEAEEFALAVLAKVRAGRGQAAVAV